MTTSIKVLIAALILLVLGLTAYIVFPYAKNYYEKLTVKVEETTIVPNVEEVVGQTQPAGKVTEITPVTDPGVTWLSEPKKLEDLGLIKKDNTIATYYKTADLDSGGEIILVQYEFNEPGSPASFLIKKDEKGKYSFLVNHSNESFALDEIFNGISNGDILIDRETRYQSLSNPNYLTTEKITFKSTGNFWAARFYKDLENPVKVVDSQYGSVYKITSVSSSDNEIVDNSTAYYLKLPDSTVVSYTVKFDFQTDNGVSLITWKDGTKNSNQYSPEGYFGCSASSGITLLDDTNNLGNRISEIGTTSSGEKVYGVKEDDQIIINAYKNYQVGREKDILSKDDFYARKPIFIYKDGLGDYILFTSADFRAAVECGKPVIYLYPQKETQVSVKVGADITKSEPIYQNGWDGVLAKPTGELTHQGQNYPYLFWEGKGLGNYPVIDSGFVVEKNNLESTLKDHLAKLGLNQKESADFLEFWLPKMPETPYTRLTWFGTRQMNELAPLSVTPTPDTVIRIFLDFAGLEKPINLKSQNLSASERIGFTLVEWGGLLRGK